ncbi:MAG: Asp-tRNA(Asn)/Glu-tRNA(Gln) amidotransferase subunit GatB [Acidimicrobiia bacterium]|nr:MAG: Asp-tRNA(Asn)/Glu-tRNA(Gln) amidotransferase subunit GatB [Acidimicrobiia bacterium]
MTTWEAVIGIETHVELQTASKMFCGCPVEFGDEPNTAVCPVCLALPGALPVANEQAIEGILSIAEALDCTLAETSLFYRKNYFYPDLPKNYQISQFTFPVGVDGHLDLEVGGEMTRIGITRVHMEEDTGKSLHQGETGRIHGAAHTLIDFNRAGVPLVEVVTEPDIRSADQARAYGTELQRIVRALGVSDARLEEGSMRFDANVSLRPRGSDRLGIRSEVKNVNSLRSMQRAIAYEIERQTEVLEGGSDVVQETRHWNEESGVTTSMRSKEESEDYRYFQEPDLLPLHIDEAWRRRVQARRPELPAKKRARYRELGADAAVAALLVDSPDLATLFEEAVAAGAEPRPVGIWLSGEVVAYLRREQTTIGDTGLRSGDLVELAAMTAGGDLSSTAAKEVLGAVLAGEGNAQAVAEARDLFQISDVSAIETVVDGVLAANTEAVAKIQGGDSKPVGFLVGQVMRATGGKADPKVVHELIRAKATG